MRLVFTFLMAVFTHNAFTTEPIKLNCIYLREQLSPLIFNHGKSAIVLENAFERNECASQSYWHINQSKVSQTSNHLIIHGIGDDTDTFLKLAKNNSKIIAESLSDLNPKGGGRIEANFGDASLSVIAHALASQCGVNIQLKGNVSGSLWVVSHSPVTMKEFCIGTADYFSAAGITLMKEENVIVGRRLQTALEGKNQQ